MLGVPLGSADRVTEREGRPLAESEGDPVETGDADIERVEAALRDTQPEALGLPLSRDEALGENVAGRLRDALPVVRGEPLSRGVALVDLDGRPLLVALPEEEPTGERVCDAASVRLCVAQREDDALLQGHGGEMLGEPVVEILICALVDARGEALTSGDPLGERDEKLPEATTEAVENADDEAHGEGTEVGDAQLEALKLPRSDSLGDKSSCAWRGSEAAEKMSVKKAKTRGGIIARHCWQQRRAWDTRLFGPRPAKVSSRASTR